MYRSAGLTCPACHAALQMAGALVGCRSCGGAWVGLTDLAARMRLVRGRREVDLELVFSETQEFNPPVRACPICRESLTPVRLGDVEVDRCPRRHGIFFDREELSAALLAASRGDGVAAGPSVDGADFDAGDALEVIGWVATAVGAVLGG